MTHTQYYDSPLGRMLMAADGAALTGLWFEGQKHFARTLTEQHAEGDLPVFAETAAWLDMYFAGRNPGPVPTLALHGSDFRLAVWDTLLAIPRGSVTTYGDITRQIAAERGLSRMSAQAVGGAVAHNPISIIVPCHRVVGTGGSLTGYAGGIARKQALLRLEGVDLSRFFVPKTGTAL
ncbi:methylated-DNA--[protein]-cysteine S-methyltransferase [uncultured Pyramidobacter sp.]|uniref:methylated-DNA--[protein]-cysteine S-methyltransferase n=1 Tax=uncultured Pyramidobacter sp. TaxID=1623495 RepID=UPI002590C797|nr:methylated-DNA--[protein]-cysteine S-methyltransferase [uncultured Pyramidobacter sp.]